MRRAKAQVQRGDRRYAKPALTHEALVARLAHRGLDISDPARAERYLRHIGYFRLSPYTIPFQTGSPDHQFRPGATFDHVLSLYVFDRKLRLLSLDALERVEVAIRAGLTDHMSEVAGPHWYTDPRWFTHGRQHYKFLEYVRGSVEEQLAQEPEALSGLRHRSALDHYLREYGSPELPPSWLMTELLTIGQLRRVVDNLGRREDREAIAQTVGLHEPLLKSWLRCYVRVRNVCAHHGRLWNLGLGVYPMTPRSTRVPWVADRGSTSTPSRGQSLYPVLISLQSVLTQVSPRSSWAGRLDALLAENPGLPWRGMGVPADWRSDPFWVEARTRGT